MGVGPEHEYQSVGVGVEPGHVWRRVSVFSGPGYSCGTRAHVGAGPVWAW